MINRYQNLFSGPNDVLKEHDVSVATKSAGSNCALALMFASLCLEPAADKNKTEEQKKAELAAINDIYDNHTAVNVSQ